MERNFLIVAANGKVRDALATDLKKMGYTVTLAENGGEAKRVVQSVSVPLVLVESHLPDMSAEQLKEELVKIRPECRVILLTSFSLVRNSPELLRFGEGDYMIRAQQVFDLVKAPLEARDEAAVHAASQENEALVQVIDVLVGLLELEYKLFGSSSHQAMQLARATAEELGANEELVVEVVLGSLLRDVGRVGVEHGMTVTDDLDFAIDAAFESVDEHVMASLRLFEHIDFPSKVLPVIRHHHERYNGTGVPDGLRGREIPMGARIVAVVDAYVSMTTGSEGTVPPEDALAQLVQRAAHEFDPEVVEAFHRVADKRLAGRRAKGKPRVLVVEGQEQFRRLLKMRLLNEGLEVLEAEDYEKALEILLKEPPDLALIDVDADAQEAFGLLQEMQSDEKLCRIPMAFLSQRSERILRLRALRQGVDDFLSKGDDMEELVARVENILLREAIRAEGEVRRSRKGITGSLENLSLPDIVQTLTIGMKTACVSLSSDDRDGRIWFENGTPKHAEAGGKTSDEAFFEMVRWTEGEFVIEHGVKSKKNSISQDSMFLLMEGLRLMDEEGDPEAAQAAS